MIRFFSQIENPPLLVGDFHFFVGVYKPNFVPILSTIGGAKLRTLSIFEGYSLDSLGMLNFVNAYGKQNWQIAIYLGLTLLSGSSDSPRFFTSEHDLAQE